MAGGLAARLSRRARGASDRREIADERLDFEPLDPLLAQALSVFGFESFFDLGAHFLERLDVGRAELFDLDEVTAVVSFQDVARFAGFEREGDFPKVFAKGRAIDGRPKAAFGALRAVGVDRSQFTERGASIDVVTAV